MPEATSAAVSRPGQAAPDTQDTCCAPTALGVVELLTLCRIHPTSQEDLAAQTASRFRAAVTAEPIVRQALLDEVVTLHLWLADSLARRFRHRGEDHQDLVQVARMGLVEASQRFDADRGIFLPFAAATILGLLKRHFRDHGWGIRPPRQTQELGAEIRREWSDLVQRLGAIPSERDLATSLGATVTAVRQARQASLGYTCSPLDLAAEPHADLASGPEEIERLEARLIVAQVWQTLDHNEQELIRLRFYEQRSQAEIAGIVGTSQMQVSRRLARLLAKLRALIGVDEMSLAS